MNKYFVWGFPGVGKSSTDSSLRIVDADCERFQFVIPEDDADSLHSQKIIEHAQPNPAYPSNYLDYIQSVDVDIVLLNCHISLLEMLDKESLLLVYPSANLKEEYLQRYLLRGDNGTYIDYMKTAFDEIILTAKNSPYRKYEIKSPHIYLQNLMERGIIMEQFIPKKELSDLLDECIQVGVYTPEGPAAGKTPDELAQMLFDGQLSLDIGGLGTNLAEKKAALAQEQLLLDRRGGLSHEELSGRIMEGIVNGALSIRHAQIAPYSYGYEVGFRNTGQGASYRWDCYCPLPQVAEEITRKIENATPQVDISALLAEIALSEQNKITSFVLESASGLQRRGYYTGHVANVQDVHRGIALDGIIQGHFQGDYSSMTTSRQNDMVRALVALKGLCLDCVHKLPSRPLVEFVIGYLKDHGTDISNPEKLNEWIRNNPDKCALPQNRERTLSRLKSGPTAAAKEKRSVKQSRKSKDER